MADGKKKRRQKLIGKQNPKKNKKKKLELDNFQFNYFNDKENFLIIPNHSNDMPVDEDHTVVEFVGQNEEVGHIDILKALWNMNRSNISITIFFTYNFLLLIL